MSYFENALRSLYYTGILDVLLPFILIFTLVYAVLQRTKILGKDSDGNANKNFNGVIALVIGLSAIIPHVLWGTGNPQNPYLSNGMLDVIAVMNNALPQVSLILVAILMLLIIIGIWGNNIEIAGSSLGGIVTVLSVIVIGVIFAISSGWMGNLPRWLYFLRDPEVQSLIVAVLIFGLIIKFITGGDNKKDPKDKSFLENMGALLKPADQSKMGK